MECYTTQAVYAFYCDLDRTIYFNSSQLQLWKAKLPPAQVPHALAMVIAHEVGHAVQDQLDPVSPDQFGPDTELQADSWPACGSDTRTGTAGWTRTLCCRPGSGRPS